MRPKTLDARFIRVHFLEFILVVFQLEHRDVTLCKVFVGTQFNFIEPPECIAVFHSVLIIIFNVLIIDL